MKVNISIVISYNQLLWRLEKIYIRNIVILIMSNDGSKFRMQDKFVTVIIDNLFVSDNA